MTGLLGLLVLGGGAAYAADSMGYVDVKSAIGMSAEDKPKAVKAKAQPATPIPATVKKVEKIVTPKPTPTPTQAPVKTAKKDEAPKVKAKPTPPKPKPTPPKAAPTPPTPTPTPTPVVAPPAAASYASTSSASSLYSSSLSSLTPALSTLHTTLTTDLDERLLKDLPSLTDDALRYRVVQLVGEMKDRARWEVVRTGEFVKVAEKETNEKWVGIVRQQRAEFDRALDSLLRDASEEARRERDSAVRSATDKTKEEVGKMWEEDAKKFREEMARQFEIQLNDEVQRVKEQCERELARRVENVNALEKKVMEVKSAVEKGGEVEAKSKRVLKVVGGVLGLIGELEKKDEAVKSGEIVPSIRALRKITEGEELIGAALQRVEKSIVASGNLPTMGSLQVRYSDVFGEARKMVFVDESKMEGLLALVRGSVAARLKSVVSVEAAMGKKDGELGDEDRLVRAGHFAATGALRKAADELDAVEGKGAKAVVNSFRKDCRSRVDADDACQLMRSRCAAMMSNV